MKKRISFILLALFALTAAVSCSDYDYPGRAIRSEKNIEKIQEAVAEKIREGGVRAMMPPTAVMISGVLFVMVTVSGFFLVVAYYGKLYHKRKMLLIEKGIYQTEKKKWDVICMFIGLILCFAGAGVSITTAAYFGPQPWTLLSGIIPLFVGIAFLIFSKMFKKHSENQ